MAGLLRQSGYRTALIGKPHFQPHLDVFQRFDENRLASSGQRGPWYGFDHVESAGHGPTVPTHYTDWLYRHHRDAVGGFATVLTGEGTWDSQFATVGMHLRTIHRDGLTCTRYEPSTTDVGGRFRVLWGIWARNCSVPRYDGTEGELYDHTEDPQQRINLWDDPGYRTQRYDLLSDLADLLPPARTPALRVAAPT